MVKNPSDSLPRTVLVTVGSTYFDALITAVLSPDIFSTLSKLGFTDLRVQYGKGHYAYDAGIERLSEANAALKVSGFSYTNSVHQEIAKAELVISHAGAGSILDALRFQKRLVAVPNETLMDNHQLELAEEMELQGYLVRGTLSDLSSAINLATTSKFTHLPREGSTKFAEILNEELALADEIY